MVDVIPKTFTSGKQMEFQRHAAGHSPSPPCGNQNGIKQLKISVSVSDLPQTAHTCEAAPPHIPACGGNTDPQSGTVC